MISEVELRFHYKQMIFICQVAASDAKKGTVATLSQQSLCIQLSASLAAASLDDVFFCCFSTNQRLYSVCGTLSRFMVS